MDSKWTGDDKEQAKAPGQPKQAGQSPSMQPGPGSAGTGSAPPTPPLSLPTRSRPIAVAVVAVVAVVALLGGIALASGRFSPGPTVSPSPVASQLAGGSPTPTPAHTMTLAGPTFFASPTASPAPAPTAVPLPALLGAIGDSYSQAWSVSPSYLRDHTQFSWVIGTDKNDGVLSLLERFQALGASPIVVDAATSGRKMSDAPRQAAAVVAAGRKLAPGQTAYVTFELGTNDLCASPDPMTDPGQFQSQLVTAITTLRTGLPPGSRILILAVPDFPHFHDITQADPDAKANLALPENADRCAPYLGASTPALVSRGASFLTAYDASLETACQDINAHDGATGRLYCTYNAALLADSDFTIGDMSVVDYFHPSLSGQAKIAADAWKADVWAAAPRP
jgi:lysophospholipase L1-like esterase